MSRYRYERFHGFLYQMLFKRSSSAKALPTVGKRRTMFPICSLPPSSTSSPPEAPVLGAESASASLSRVPGATMASGFTSTRISPVASLTPWFTPPAKPVLTELRKIRACCAYREARATVSSCEVLSISRTSQPDCSISASRQRSTQLAELWVTTMAVPFTMKIYSLGSPLELPEMRRLYRLVSCLMSSQCKISDNFHG